MIWGGKPTIVGNIHVSKKWFPKKTYVLDMYSPLKNLHEWLATKYQLPTKTLPKFHKSWNLFLSAAKVWVNPNPQSPRENPYTTIRPKHKTTKIPKTSRSLCSPFPHPKNQETKTKKHQKPKKQKSTSPSPPPPEKKKWTDIIHPWPSPEIKITNKKNPNSPSVPIRGAQFMAMAIRIPCTTFTCYGIRTSTSQGAPWLTETWRREDVWCWEPSLHHLAWEIFPSGLGNSWFRVLGWCLMFGVWLHFQEIPETSHFLWVFAWKNGCIFSIIWLSLKGWCSKHDCGRKSILTQLSHIILPERRGKNLPAWSKRLHRKRREKWQIPTTTKK